MKNKVRVVYDRSKLGPDYRPMKNSELSYLVQRIIVNDKGFYRLVDKIDYLSDLSLREGLLLLPEHTGENSNLLSDEELREYALGVVSSGPKHSYLDDLEIKIRLPRKSTLDEAIDKLAEITEKIGADAIEARAYGNFDKGYQLVGVLFVKR